MNNSINSMSTKEIDDLAERIFRTIRREGLIISNGALPIIERELNIEFGEPTNSIKIGQVYEDKDRRKEAQYLKVVGILKGYAFLQSCTPNGIVHKTGRRARICLKNLQRSFKLKIDVQ